MTTLRTMLLGALVVAGLVAPAEARPDRARPQVGQKAAGNGGKRDKVKQRIRIMRAMVLTEQLDLDEATAGKLFPVLDKYDDVLAKLLAERAALRDKLATARAARSAGRQPAGAVDRRGAALRRAARGVDPRAGRDAARSAAGGRPQDPARPARRAPRRSG